MNLFLTGTDTGVGKTYCASLLIRGLRKAGFDTAAMKPICCGSLHDSELLRAASGDTQELNEVNPVWLRVPAAPYTAAIVEGRQPADLRPHPRHLRPPAQGPPFPHRRGRGRLARPHHTRLFRRRPRRRFRPPRRRRRPQPPRRIEPRPAHRPRHPGARPGVRRHHLEQHRRSPEGEETTAITTNKSVLEDVLQVPVLFEIAEGQQEIVLGVA